MSRYRSLLSGLFALITIVLVGCSGPTVKAPPQYTAAQIEQLSGYATSLSAVEDRTRSELSALIEKEDWTYVRNFIHGPLGTIRQTMSLVSQNLLLPEERKAALAQAREVFVHLEAIDKAALNQNATEARSEFKQSLAEFDEFLGLIPDSSVLNTAS
ncbi:MAG: photosystem II protein PsbQ [Oscillatoriales cyanobacterium]|nr:MAG: photosystem II protein PsbQ [Oscillatoriales cyanobacterium]